MPPESPRVYAEIARRVGSRWLTVRASGILVAGEPRKEVVASIASHGPARTLYRHQRPVCRSLDGITSSRRTPAQRCALCPVQRECTPQILLHLQLDDVPYRLMLAHSSARNFLGYLGRLGRRHLEVEQIDTRIVVLSHGTWGELSFHPADDRCP